MTNQSRTLSRTRNNQREKEEKVQVNTNDFVITELLFIRIRVIKNIRTGSVTLLIYAIDILFVWRYYLKSLSPYSTKGDPKP